MADLFEKCPHCGKSLVSSLGKIDRCPECGIAIPPVFALTVKTRAKPSTSKPSSDVKSGNRGDNERVQSPSRRSKGISEKRVSGRPLNPYLTPLQLVSGAYFPFLGGMVLASAALGVLRQHR